MKVLIIGGTRFMGYQLAWRVLAMGHQLTLLNRGTRPDPYGDRVTRIMADHTSPGFAKAVQGHHFDAAIDFAGYTGDDAQRAIDALGDGRVGHYVFISTGQVYLVRQGCPQPSRESDYAGPTLPEPIDPIDRADWIYGIEKRKAEDTLGEAWATVGFPSTRLRIPMVNGERDHYRRVESYLWRILDGGPVILPDGGRQPIRHVYSGSVVRAITAILGNSSTFGQVYNLAQSETPGLHEIVSLLAEMLGATARTVAIASETLRDNGFDPAKISPFSGRWMSFLDPGRACDELGFRHEALSSYLDKIVAVFLNAPPEGPPENYARRGFEIELARRS